MSGSPDFTDTDETWMRRALELGRRGVGLCSPNPAVGCVLVDRNGRLAGEGWHEYDLRDHAEIAALESAQTSDRERVRGGTAYVTLEPCNHTGRTGPCSQALIAAGIARVVAATGDPNQLVAGKGVKALEKAGVAVEVGLGEAEARRMNEGFAKWIVSHKPFVHMKIAMTLDGKIAPPPAGQARGQTHWITGEASRAAVQLLRWQADAVLTGIDTVICDDPLLTDRSGQARRRPLMRVVLDSRLRLPLESKLVATANEDLFVFTTSRQTSRIEELMRRGVRVLVVGSEDGRVPLAQVFERLGEEGILTVLTECGQRLNTALLASGLVDRLTAFISPQIYGEEALAAFGPLADTLNLTSFETEWHGADLSLSSLLRDPWEAAETK